ncbi:ribose 5-phosphate isomerase B [Pectinatus haikarae]|uniref:Ribose 5-phosphate isomerase B n=1 Tax=Pectinatus haikarae TaxID=349096 RepID=A0ABT9YB78_9FIRM|nr:ribose 5-phosphate isomerase B [Pectinatus haikarae]
MKKKIVIGSDHAGFEMKNFLIDTLIKDGYVVEDKGPFNDSAVDAGVYAIAVGEEVARHLDGTLGILVCGTGIGMSIMANKVKYIRASLVTDLFSAKMTKAHNNANVLCIGARIFAKSMAAEMMDVWLNTEFLGGKYADRVQNIINYEDDHKK